MQTKGGAVSYNRSMPVQLGPRVQPQKSLIKYVPCGMSLEQIRISPESSGASAIMDRTFARPACGWRKVYLVSAISREPLLLTD
jgi:hypothetical protein